MRTLGPRRDILLWTVLRKPDYTVLTPSLIYFSIHNVWKVKVSTTWKKKGIEQPVKSANHAKKDPSSVLVTVFRSYDY